MEPMPLLRPCQSPGPTERMDRRQSERRSGKRLAGSAELKEMVCRLAVFFRQIVYLLRGC
ncbi:hypothetical protein [Mesorhizobium sp. M0276]|uniref:hypothetical protein n=1 Tax=Mesorhizobium sp. M0276 TaxID=2956928 RepID=UPI00333A40A4